MPSSPLDVNQTRYLAELYAKRPELFTPEKVQEIAQAADTFGIELPVEFHENYLVELPKQLLGGFIKEFTIFVDPFDQPKTMPAAIAKSIGGVFGFVGNFFGMGYPLKAAGKALAGKAIVRGAQMEMAAEAAERTVALGKALTKAGQFAAEVPLRSLPMLAADVAQRALRKVPAYTSALEYLGGQHRILRQMADQGLHLGMASAAAGTPDGVGAMIQHGLFGTVAGGAFAGIGNMPMLGQSTTMHNLAKAAAGGIFQGLPSTIQGQTAPEQIYNYLLGAYFGFHATDVHTYDASRILQTIPASDRQFAMTSEYVKELNLDGPTFKRLGEMVEKIYQPVEAPKGFRDFLMSLGPGGQRAAEQMEREAMLPEGAEIPGASGEAYGVVLGGTRPKEDFYIIRRNSDNQIVKVDKETANRRWLTSLPTKAEVENDLVLAGETVVDATVSGKEDFDTVYAPLLDGRVRFMGKLFPGRKMDRRTFDGHLRNIHKAMDSMVRTARTTSGNRQEAFDKAYLELREWANDLARANGAKKEITDFGDIVQDLRARVDGLNVPTYAIDLRDATLEKLPSLPATSERNRDGNLVVDKQFNTKDTRRPINPLQELHGEDVMTLIETFTDYEGRIKGFDEFPWERLPKIVSLVKETSGGNHYLAHGFESKPVLWTLRYRVAPEEVGPRMRELYDQIREWDPKFAEKYKAERNRATSYGGWNKTDFDRAFLSNIEYYRDLFGRDLSLKEVFTSNEKGQFVNSLLEFNKRLQIAFNSFYRLTPETAGRPDGKPYRYIVAEDYDKLPEIFGRKIAEGEISDGAIMILQSDLDAMNAGSGLPTSGGLGKPFVFHRNDQLGSLMGKAAFHGIPDNSEFGRWMDKNRLDMIMFRTATKQFGKRDIHQLGHDGKDFTATTADGKLSVYDLPVTDVMLSWQGYDKGVPSISEPLAKQLWNTFTPAMVGEKASRDMTKLLLKADQSEEDAKRLLDDFVSTGKKEYLDRLFIWNPDGTLHPESRVHDVGVSDLLAGMHASPVFERQALAYILRNAVANTRGGKLEADFDGEDVDKQGLADLRSAMELLRIEPGAGIDPALIRRKDILPLAQRVMHSFFVKSLTRPNQKGAFKAIMRVWDPELLKNLEYNEKYFYLDNGLRDVRIKGIGTDGLVRTMTLEDQWNLYDGLRKTRKQKALQKKMLEAMTPAVLRVPMDNHSGARMLQFNGFTGRKGNGILLHGKVMKALGGADLDIDSASGYFGLPQSVREALIAAEGTYGRYGKQYPHAERVLEEVDPMLQGVNMKEPDIVSTMSPYSRVLAGLGVSKGRELMLPIAVSGRFTTLQFYEGVVRAAKKGAGGGVRLRWGRPYFSEELALKDVDPDETGSVEIANDFAPAKKKPLPKERPVKGRGEELVVRKPNAQDYVVLYPNTDNGDSLAALASRAINFAADLAGKGGMIHPDTLAALYLHLAFPKIEVHKADGSVRDITGETAITLKGEWRAPVYSEELLGFAREARNKIEEYKGLLDANSALYGRNRWAGKAWSTREVKEMLEAYPFAFYEGTPFTELVRSLSKMDMRYDLFHLLSSNPKILERLREKTAALDTLLKTNTEVRNRFTWMKREAAVEIATLADRMSHVMRWGRFHADSDPVVPAFDITTRAGRYKLAGSDAFFDFYDPLLKLMTKKRLEMDLKGRRKWVREKYDYEEADAFEPGARREVFNRRLRFIESELSSIGDFFSTRVNEIADYPFLADWYERTGLGELRENPATEGVADRIVRAIWKRADFFKDQWSKLYAQEKDDARRARYELPEEDAPRKKEAVRRVLTEDEKGELKELVAERKLLEKQKAESSRELDMRKETPSARSYLEGALGDPALERAAWEQWFSDMRERELELDRWQANYRDALEGLAANDAKLRDFKERTTVYPGKPGEKKAAMFKDLTQLVRYWEDSKNQLNRILANYETAGLTFDKEAILDLMDAFLLADIRQSRLMPTRHSALGLKVANSRVLESYKNYWRETFDNFVSPKKFDKRYIQEHMLRSKITDSIEKTTRKPQTQERVMWEQLPEGEIVNQEVKELTANLIKNLKHWPTLTRDDMVDFIRWRYGYSQPHQLSIQELRGLNEIVEGWIRGPGFFREYLGWLRAEGAKKGPKPPGFFDWLNFMEASADRMKKNVITKVTLDLYDDKGMVNEKKLRPLRYHDPESGKTAWLYASQALIKSPLNRLMDGVTKSRMFSAQQNAMDLEVMQKHIGWTQRGITHVKTGTDRWEEFNERAVYGMELDGAKQYLAELERNMRNNLSLPRHERVTPAQIESAKRDVAVFRERFHKSDKFYDEVKGEEFNIETRDEKGATTRSIMSGAQVFAKYKQDMTNHYADMRGRINMSAKHKERNLEFDYDNGWLTLSANRSWKDLRELYDFVGRLTEEQLIPYDMVRLAFYSDINHYLAQDRAKEDREGLWSPMRDLYDPVTGKPITGTKERLALTRTVEDLTFWGGKANQEFQRAIEDLPAEVRSLPYNQKRIFLAEYLNGWRAGLSEKKGQPEYFTRKAALKRSFADVRVRGVKAGLEAAALRKGNKAWERTHMEHYWEVSNYLGYTPGPDNIFRAIYGMENVSEYLLDLDYTSGAISPETYFYKHAEMQRPFMQTRFKKGYFPHMNHDPKVVEQWQAEQTDMRMRGVDPASLSESQRSALRMDLNRIANAVTSNRLVSETEDGYLNLAMTEMFNGKGSMEDGSARKVDDIRMMMSGNMLTRTHNIPGYDLHPSVHESYIRKLSSATYNSFAAFQAKRLLAAFERGQYMGPATNAWSTFARFYVRDVMGHPVLFDEHHLTDPQLNITKTPYYWLSEHNAFMKTTKFHDTALKLAGLDRLSPPEKADLAVELRRKPTEEDIARAIARKMQALKAPTPENMKRFSRMLGNLSILEGQYQLATLLASTRTMFGNIYGGSVNTAVWTGARFLRDVFDMDVWRAINPKWKSLQDVHNWVFASGAIEEFIIHEANIIKKKYGKKGALFVDAAIKKLQQDPSVSDKTMVQLAREYGIKDSVLEKASWFMRRSERFLRANAFLAAYLQARSDIDAGLPLDYENPWLMDTARKAMGLTQFLYGNDTRPPFTRSSLGHIYARFKLWGWSNVRFQRQIFEAARDAGFRPGSAEVERVRRLMTANLFAIGLASLLPYTLFDASLPAPLNYFQNLADWLFGDDKERERAFFTGSTGLPTILAPLNELLPPIARIPKGLVDAPATFAAIWGGDPKAAAALTTYTLFPFGRMTKDVWRALNDPVRAVDILSGLPLNTIARMRQKEILREKRREEGRVATAKQQERAMEKGLQQIEDTLPE